MTGAHQTAARSLAATGERLVPALQHGELVQAEHLARYRLASQLADGRRVLDAACGEGYGSAILAGAGARSVVGVDRDPESVEHARRRYASRFEVADVAALPFEDGAFDLVVSFETIEHVSHPEAALAEFRRVLADRGTLVLSTPNLHEYLVDNEFHEREFTHEEFVALLSDRFSEVEVLLQHNWVASVVFPPELAADSAGELPHPVDLYKVAGIAAGGELYTIALCGSVPRLDATNPVGVAAATDEAHQLAQRLSSAEQTAERWHREYLEAEGTAQRWHREFREAQELTLELRAAYDDSAAALDRIYRSRSWRLSEPLRRAAQLRRRRRA